MENNFSSGVVIPHKLGYCSDCSKVVLCDKCDNLVNRSEESQAFLNYLGRQVPDKVGHMLPWHRDNWNESGEKWDLRYFSFEIFMPYKWRQKTTII